MTTVQFLHRRDGPDHIVNVASVPLRSPFRYPGGKTWLVPRIRQWLASITPPTLFIEPFAGGGIVSLTVAFESLAKEILMVEIDQNVAAVWETILDPKNSAWLCKRITDYQLTRDNCYRDLRKKSSSKRQTAFQTILRNRVCHGGILARRAGFIVSGANGKGLSSRWYPMTLKKRIEEIQRHANKIRFRHDDAFAVMGEFKNRKNACFFIAPPYTASSQKTGARLYTHFEVDHEQLFRLAAECRGYVLMTYDNAEEIHDLANRYGFQTCAVAMKNNHHDVMTELLVGKNLDWLG